MGRAAIDINKKQFEQIMMSCGSFFTADQVSECLDVGRMTLYRWIKKNYPKDDFDTLRKRFSSKAKYQLNAYRWKAMANGNARLIERSMEEEGLWEKRNARSDHEENDIEDMSGIWGEIHEQDADDQLGQIQPEA